MGPAFVRHAVDESKHMQRFYEKILAPDVGYWHNTALYDRRYIQLNGGRRPIPWTCRVKKLVFEAI